MTQNLDVALGGPGLDGDGAAVGGGLDGVEEQVVDHALDQLGIEGERRTSANSSCRRRTWRGVSRSSWAMARSATSLNSAGWGCSSSGRAKSQEAGHQGVDAVHLAGDEAGEFGGDFRCPRADCYAAFRRSRAWSRAGLRSSWAKPADNWPRAARRSSGERPPRPSEGCDWPRRVAGHGLRPAGLHAVSLGQPLGEKADDGQGDHPQDQLRHLVRRDFLAFPIDAEQEGKNRWRRPAP